MNFIETKNTLELGSGDVVILDKLFGPTIMTELRITADVEEGWIIERRWIATGEWVKWVTIPGQIEQEFTSPEDSN